MTAFDWDKLLDTLAAAPARIERLLGSSVMPGSRASTERPSLNGDLQRQAFLDHAPPRALVNIRLLDETIEATTRLLRLPPVQVMSGPVVRAGLIASGLTLWMLEPEIDADERSRRMVSILAEDLNSAARIAHKGDNLGTPEQKSELNRIFDDITKKQERLNSDSAGLKRPALPNDEVLGTKPDAEYEYQLYTQIAHGNPTAIAEMRAMFRNPDASIVGVALVNYILSLAHAYFRAVWAVGSYMLKGEQLEELRKHLVDLYEAMGSNEAFYSYLRKAEAAE